MNDRFDYVLGKYPDGEQTKIAKNNIQNFITDDDTYDDVWTTTDCMDNFIRKLNDTGDFLYTWIMENREQIGFCGTDKESLCQFIADRYIATGFTGDRKSDYTSFNKSNIMSWIKDGKLMSKRKHIFMFCFAMKLDISKTIEFMNKACLQSGFNFKDIEDIVFYFCLNNKKTYQEAVDIINKINDMLEKDDNNDSDNIYADNDTAVIQSRIQSMTDTSELIEYIRYNRSGFKSQYRTAVDALDEQIKIAFWYSEYYRKEYDADKINKKDECKTLDISKISISELMVNVLYDFYKEGDEEALKRRENIKDTDLPDLLGVNFPQHNIISKLIKGGKVSTDQLRKALILFWFYNCCAKAELDDIDMEDFYDSFIDGVDDLLYNCGLQNFYIRNPYDALFAVCARQPDPYSNFTAFTYNYMQNKDGK